MKTTIRSLVTALLAWPAVVCSAAIHQGEVAGYVPIATRQEYYTGTSDLQSGRFSIEKHGRMNHGPVMRGSLHAPSGFV